MCPFCLQKRQTKFGFSLGFKQLQQHTTTTQLNPLFKLFIERTIYDSKVTQEIIDLGDGRSITIETGKLKQADGSVVVRMGDAMLLATAVSARTANPGVDFTINSRLPRKICCCWSFPGGFFKREARPSDQEILTMRLVDRVLRPLFPDDYHAETQVMIQLMSHDDNVMPDALAGLAASAALAVSDIPFYNLISEVRVAE